ncbi:Uncharacterised protein [Yersinia intermedia]|uniref:Uncharacterized protein n=1 Tax=Yersinia intermedia TaxID=631 RepID=A0A0T9LSR9_YERIN|nr:Uncharacterised protein [Yersinia intermedia]
MKCELRLVFNNSGESRIVRILCLIEANANNSREDEVLTLGVTHFSMEGVTSNMA